MIEQRIRELNICAKTADPDAVTGAPKALRSYFQTHAGPTAQWDERMLGAMD
jgi:hypothetical protein